MRRRHATAILATFGIAALLIAGCGEPTVPTPAGSGDLVPSPSSMSPVASPTLDPDIAPPSPPAGAATVDSALLDVLPDAIDGVPLTPDEETAALIAADPTTDAAIERLAVGVYVDPSDSVETDVAVVSVVGLAPGTFDEAWFRAWRDTYDAAACEVAGGLAAAGAESTIADHDTFIGTCQGGVHTYHVHLPDPDRVVAITAVGPARFGERVVAGLEE